MRVLAIAAVVLLGSLGPLGPLGCSSKAPTKTVRVAAAGHLARAFEEVGKAFAVRTGVTPIFTFGSSGKLAKQIEQGAPFFLFASASTEFAEVPIAAGRCDRSSMIVYAHGELAVWTPPGIPGPKTFAELADPRFTRIAIANPDHAPYGKAALQALEKAGIYAAVKDRLVLGDNVQAAFEFARSKNADAAIIALSLVVDKGSFLPVDKALHETLDQALVVCGTGEEAERGHELADFLASPDGREIMTRYGFSIADKPPVAKP